MAKIEIESEDMDEKKMRPMLCLSGDDVIDDLEVGKKVSLIVDCILKTNTESTDDDRDHQCLEVVKITKQGVNGRIAFAQQYGRGTK